MKLLDLFCGAGGCSVGYHRAGFEVFGVDIVEQPNYPFGFTQADAIEFLQNNDLSQFDVIHASPPCQAYSRTKSLNKDRKYQKLISQVRKLIEDYNYVIENVEHAKPVMKNYIRLCGEMFGLKVIRHRLFESNLPLREPKHKKHQGKVINYARQRGEKGYYYWGVYGHNPGTIEEWQNAMGIDWTNNKEELAEAIPPDYTEYIGQQIKEAIR